MIWFGRVAKLHYGVLRCSLSSASGKSSSAIQVPYLSRQWCRYGAPRPVHYYSTLPPATDGERVCSSTSIDTVLNQDFQILINSTIYRIHSPGRESPEHSTSIDDMKTVVHMLQSALNLPEHQLLRQIQLLRRLDTLKQELGPLEEVRAQVAVRAESQSMRVEWAVLAFLSLQGSFLGYLTWFVFAWDVMEPVTYFITYATSMGFLGYYILTKQELLYPDAKDRQFLHFFHKRAAMEHFDTHRYNALRDQLATVESDLKRLRKPIQLQLPVDPIQPSN
ncbi:calcium uniporter protein, mitochondrial-like isoform X2 [Oncorhynchus masou masou]|uniref:calcium uniporter protein, mitochondrial-like isoform X2 n=1 Tax=Oncorhynchus masou masou TaxID=90313 RepID=UPI0031841E07